MSLCTPRRSRRSGRHRACGFTLIELAVATAIALFLLGGLLTVLENMRRTQNNQALLTQLQDSQRIAMSLLNSVLQSAGYFPDPTVNTQVGALPAATVASIAFAAGQMVYGTSVTADPGDTVTVRFTTATSDTIINCIGGTNTSGANASYVNTFSIVGGQLVCSLNGGATSPLVSGLKRMDVKYGVKRDFTTDNANVDTYLQAKELTAADWSNVSSIRVRLAFVNPLANQAGQPATFKFTRVVAVMARAGVKT
jgi:type IV pilus assembly protein PilW